MSEISRRHVLQASGALAASSMVPWTVAAIPLKPISFTQRKDLPVLELDVEATVAERKIVTKGYHYSNMPTGAIIKVPAGQTIPIAWWGINFRRNAQVRDGARFIVQGGDRFRRPQLVADGKAGGFDINDRSGRALSIEFENMVLQTGSGGDGVRVSYADRVRFNNMKITSGKNGVFVATGMRDIDFVDTEILHCGRGDGHTHNVYIVYARNVTVRDSRFHSPRAEGHVFKCYAAHLDVRNSYFAHYDTATDYRDGFYGILPMIDRGAWGSTIAIGNTFVRRGPVRSTMIELRNRGFPPGYIKWVAPDWGTKEVDHRLVDNRDPTNPHLFRHLLYRNRVLNGVMPDRSLDPLITRNPGSLIRNNGSHPWVVFVKGKYANDPQPADWQPHNERTVAYLCQNKVEGVPFRRLGDNAPYANPNLRTPIEELDSLPDWARDWAAV